MRKRYLALFLVIATVFVQAIGTGQTVKAAEAAAETASEGDALPEEKQGAEEDVMPEEKQEEERKEKKSMPKAQEISPQSDGIEGNLTILSADGQELQDGAQIWIYEDETKSFSVERESSEIVWEIGYSDGNGEDILFQAGAADNPVTWEISGNTIAITGKKETAQENVFVHAKCGDEIATLWLDVKQNILEVRLGLEDEVRVLQGSETSIGSEMGDIFVENAEYPEGAAFFFQTRSMKSADETIADVAYEDEWRVYGKKVGRTSVAVEYYAENEPEKIMKKDVAVIVTDEEYSIDIVSAEGNSLETEVLFGDTVDLTANVTGVRLDENGEYESIDFIPPGEIEIDWSYEADSAGEVTAFTPEAERCTVTVGKSENLESYAVIVKASISKNGENIGFQLYHIGVSGSYYLLESGSVNTDIQQGESTEISGLGLYGYQYSEAGKEREPVRDARFSFQYDENIFRITDSDGAVINNEIDGEEPNVQAADFVIERLGIQSGNIRVCAWMKDENDGWIQKASKEWLFDWCSVEDVNFDKEYLNIFSSSDYDKSEVGTLSVNTENLRNYTIKWEVGIDNDNEEPDEYGNSRAIILDENSYTTSGNEITLDADTLKQACMEYNMECTQLHGYVRAEITVGEVAVAEAYAVLEIRTPEYRLSDAGLNKSGEAAKGSCLYYQKNWDCYVKNQAYPDGEQIPVTINSIEIGSTDGGEAVWERQEEDAENFFLKAMRCGKASLTIKTSSEELGERDFIIHTNVLNEIYSLEADRQEWALLPGESKQMKVNVIRGFYNEKEGMMEYEEIKDPGAYTLDYVSEHRLITVGKDGILTASKNVDGNEWCQIRVTLTVPGESGEPYVYTEEIGIPVCMGHKFVRVGTEAASCNEEGYVEWECTECYMTRIEKVPKTSHSYVETGRKPASCTANGSVTKKCSRCGATSTETLPKTGHSFGPWAVTTKPTALKQGVETRTCKVCRKAETRNIKKLKATIKLNVKSIILKVKQSTTAIEVTTAKGDSVKSWKSSNTKIAAVTSKGKITGKKAGTAKITVTLKSGVKATVNVKVQKKAVVTSKLAVTGKTVKIKGNKLTLKKGKSETLVAALTPVTSQQKVTYKTSNKKIAAVNSKGKITAKKLGKAKITVQSGKKKVVITVTVKK